MILTMSVEIWPPISPEELQIAQEKELKRELDWLLEELHRTLIDLKHGLEDCYALLAPVDPGSTLVLSTHRNEIVKGTVTRVGTRIVKGTIHVRLRTLPAQTLTLNPDHPIHLGPLTSLHTLLTHSLDLLTLTLAYCYSPETTSPSTPAPTPAAITTAAHPPETSPQFIAAQLRLLSQHLSEATSLLKGPSGPADPTAATADLAWTTHSAAPSHFRPPLARPDLDAPPPLSFYLGIQDGCLVLWLRSLEPVDAPVNLGTKLALAVGAARRLEHDESERVFGFCCDGDDGNDNNDSIHGHNINININNGNDNSAGKQQRAQHRDDTSRSVRRGRVGSRSSVTGTDALPRPRAGTGGGSSSTGGTSSRRPSSATANGGASADPMSFAAADGGRQRRREVEVYVREKVRVESADPSLMSLTAKLTALGNILDLARRNLATVMGEESDAEGED